MSAGWSDGIVITAYAGGPVDLSTVPEINTFSQIASLSTTPIVLTSATNFFVQNDDTTYTIRYDTTQDLIVIQNNTLNRNTMFFMATSNSTYAYVTDLNSRSFMSSFSFIVEGEGTYNNGISTFINLLATPGDASVSISWSIPNTLLSDMAGGFFQVADLMNNSIAYTFANVTPNYATSTTTFNATISTLIDGSPIPNNVPVAYILNGWTSSSILTRSLIVLATPTAASPPPPPPPTVPCFPTGTLLRTPAGDKPVEALVTGDYVLTADNRPVPVRIYSFHVAKATEANAPYEVPANALGPRQPRRTLHLSPDHAFQIRPNVWFTPKLAAGRSVAIRQYGLGEPVTYYHVECPNFFRDNLVADGVVCESFGCNQAKGLKSLYRYAPTLGGYTRVSNQTFAKKA
jgi:hypothetical protein